MASAALVAVTVQVPDEAIRVRTLPATEQVAGVLVPYVTPPVPELPVVPRAWVS